MKTAANPAYRPNPDDVRAMNRALGWSIGIHVAFVLALIVVPRDWISDPPRPVMTISLGGTSGPTSTGTTSIGSRTVEQVAPPPRRPEPVRPPQAKPAPTVVKPPPQTVKPAPTEKPAPKPPPQTVRPPTTGRQVMQGNVPADTGSRTQGQGLTFGGGGTGGEINLADFCCPEYIRLLTAEIDSNWQKNQPQRGTTVIRFTILKDGRITDMQVIRPSGSPLLDRASQRALIDSRFPPLPAQYPADRLTVNLTFPYEGH